MGKVKHLLPCPFLQFSLTSKQKTPGSPGAYQKQKIHQPCSTKNLTNQTQFSKSYSSYSFPKPFSLKKFTLLPKPSTTSAISQAGETSSSTLSASTPTTHSQQLFSNQMPINSRTSNHLKAKQLSSQDKSNSIAINPKSSSTPQTK